MSAKSVQLLTVGLLLVSFLSGLGVIPTGVAPGIWLALVVVFLMFLLVTAVLDVLLTPPHNPRPMAVVQEPEDYQIRLKTILYVPARTSDRTTA